MEVRIAKSDSEKEAAFNIRYKVFVEELGTIPKDFCVNGLEKDRYDEYSVHFIALKDKEVVGTVRLQEKTDDFIDGTNFLYGLAGESLYDYSVIYNNGVILAEIARSSVLPGHRKQSAIFNLWKAIYLYVVDRKIHESITMAAPDTDSIEDAMIVYDIGKRKGIIHPMFDLRAKNKFSNLDEIESPIYTDEEKKDVLDLDLPRKISMYSDIGYLFCGEPLYYPKFRRVVIPMMCNPDGVSSKVKRLFDRPSKNIDIT